MNGKKYNFKKGFTLVEMLVAAAIFSLLMAGIAGIFVSALQSQRYTLMSQHLIDQGSYALEYMGRMLRMAVKDDGSCGFSGYTYLWDGTNKILSFKKYDGTCKNFHLNSASKRIYDNADNFLTSSKIEAVNFNVNTMDTGLQPRATIYLELKGKGSGSQPTIRLQTTISKRELNL